MRAYQAGPQFKLNIFVEHHGSELPYRAGGYQKILAKLIKLLLALRANLSEV